MHRHAIPIEDARNNVATSHPSVGLRNRDLLHVGGAHDQAIKNQPQEHPCAMEDELRRLHNEAIKLGSPMRSTGLHESFADCDNANANRPMQPTKLRASGSPSIQEHHPFPIVFGGLKMEHWYTEDEYKQPWNPLRHQANAASDGHGKKG
jgi:hypothetical protein